MWLMPVESRLRGLELNLLSFKCSCFQMLRWFWFTDPGAGKGAWVRLLHQGTMGRSIVGLLVRNWNGRSEKVCHMIGICGQSSGRGTW